MIARGEPIVGGGAGTGLSAKCEEAGGIDLIVIYNSGRFRMAGRGSLSGLMPYGDANAIVMEMAARGAAGGEADAGAGRGLRHRSLPLHGRLSRRVKRAGFLRRAELPHGRADRRQCSAQKLEETGMGYGLEVEMIALADAKGLSDDALRVLGRRCGGMAGAGADIIVCHFGLTDRRLDRGAKRHSSSTMSRRMLDAWAEAALSVNPDAIILVHGGPVAEPPDAEFIIKNTRHCHGFYGASSMERLPVEVAIRDQTREFKAIGRKGGTDENPAGTTRRSSAACAGRRRENRHDGATDRSPHSLAHRRGHRHRDHRLSGELAVPPLVEGGVVRPYRPLRRKGGDRLRRLRAADHP